MHGVHKHIDLNQPQRTAENMAALDALTSQDSIDAFAALYKKCVVRDTPIEATGEGVKAEVTCD